LEPVVFRGPWQIDPADQLYGRRLVDVVHDRQATQPLLLCEREFLGWREGVLLGRRWARTLRARVRWALVLRFVSIAVAVGVRLDRRLDVGPGAGVGRAPRDRTSGIDRGRVDRLLIAVTRIAGVGAATDAGARREADLVAGRDRQPQREGVAHQRRDRLLNICG